MPWWRNIEAYIEFSGFLHAELKSPSQCLKNTLLKERIWPVISLIRISCGSGLLRSRGLIHIQCFIVLKCTFLGSQKKCVIDATFHISLDVVNLILSKVGILMTPSLKFSGTYYSSRISLILL